MVAVGLYFQKFRNFAYGVVTAAVGVGGMVLPYIIEYSNEVYSWRGTMLILSGIFLNMTITAVLCKPPVTTNVHIKASDKCSLDVSLDVPPGISSDRDDEMQTFKNGSWEEKDVNDEVIGEIHSNDNVTTRKYSICQVGFISVCIGACMLNAALYIVYVHFPAMFIENGSSDREVSLCLSIIGICNIIGRLCAGIATSNQDFDVMLTFMAVASISGFIYIICPLLSLSTAGRFVFSVLFGLYGNLFFSMLAPVTIWVLKQSDLSVAYGVENVFLGFSALIGPPFAGWLNDVSGSYLPSFYTAGTIAFVSTLVLMMTVIFEKPPAPIRNKDSLSTPGIHIDSRSTNLADTDRPSIDLSDT